jgi:hypothetical protein
MFSLGSIFKNKASDIEVDEDLLNEAIDAGKERQEQTQAQDEVDTDLEGVEIDFRHSIIIANYRSVQRSPFYALALFILSFIGMIYSLTIFINSTEIDGTSLFIPSTTSDTAVVPINTTLHILPIKDQERYPGATYTEEETDALVREYLVDALNDCFSMNYLNNYTVLGKCRANHLDSETDAQDIFIQLLKRSNFLDIMKKYETASKLHIDVDSIQLLHKLIAERDLGHGFTRQRAVWIFRLDMYFTMENVEITSPTKWEVELIRESAFNKEFPVSLFKIRDLNISNDANES